MAILKCKMCGGDLNITADEKIVECEFCGTTQTIPDGSDEKKTNLFNRANRLRMDNEFDKAAGVYESIVSEFPEDAEGYWGLVLCSYGIEYVDDPKTGKKIPTCHRTLTSSVMDDDNFVQACENADVVARGIYREEAKAIDKLQQQIIAVVENEEPYDVFICYKETDDITKQRTEDSLIAQDIYTELIKEGYKVFFSRVTLRDKAGTEYEPYIYAALKSAKIMLAIGTKFDYYDAVWVKNEWSRYISMMADDSSKHLIPCFKNLDAYDIPKEFKNLQALDMGEVTFFKNLTNNVERLIPKQKEEQIKAADTVSEGNNATIDSLLKRVFMFLEDGNWKSANEYCEKVLDINPECADAYLGKLMAEGHWKKEDEIGSGYADNSDIEYVIEDSGEKIKLIKIVMEVTGKALSDAKKLVDSMPFTLKVPSKYASELEAICKTHKNRNHADVQSSPNYEKFVRFASKERVQEINSHIESCKRKAEEEKEREQQQRQEEEKLFKEKIETYAIKACQSSISARAHTVALKSDGTVVTVGNNVDGRCNISDWTDIVAISAGHSHTVGLKPDGTVVATEYAGREKDYYGQCDVTDWKDIIAICAGPWDTVGLKSDGTVVAVGSNNNYKCDVSKWTDIVAISAGLRNTVGLKADGTVVTTEPFNKVIPEWEDIIAISEGDSATLGLKYDGTVIADGINTFGECDVAEWEDIVAISAGKYHTIGLKADGTVVACGNNDDGQCNVSEWEDIVAVSAGEDYTIGLKSNGSVVAVGSDFNGRCNVSDWHDIALPSKAKTKEEFEAERAQMQERLRELYRKNEEEKKKCDELFKTLITQIKSKKDGTMRIIKFEKIIAELTHQYQTLLRVQSKWSAIEANITSCNHEIQAHQAVISKLNNEKSSLGFFELKRKKYIAAEIASCEEKIRILKHKITTEETNKSGFSSLESLNNKISETESTIKIKEELSNSNYGSQLLSQYYFIDSIKVGNLIEFGSYPQSGANHKKDIEWSVLEVKDGKALVISKHALDCKQYDTSYTGTTWETCTLRKWLNNDFISAAFSNEEKEMISETTVAADKHPEHDTYPGSSTVDKVFLLSFTEANKYFSSDSVRQCKATDYAISNSERDVVRDGRNTGYCYWLLRTPGHYKTSVVSVSYNGSFFEAGSVVYHDNPIRPAMWIEFDKNLYK